MNRADGQSPSREAILYEKKPGGDVICRLCPHLCRIPEGKRGLCGVRENRAGTLYTLVYGRLIARHVDPIEKKPLYHFLPGTLSYSVATAGCNLSCRYCQNYQISMEARSLTPIPGQMATPEEVVGSAQAAGCLSIAYTYTEPTIFMEFALDCASRGKEAGLANIFVTNGFMTPEAAAMASEAIDAANIDIKAATEEGYRAVCGGRLQPVLDTVRRFYEKGVWIEITTLIIPGFNDDRESLESIASFIASLDPAIPWHLSRFFPAFKMPDRPPTPVKTLELAEKVGKDAGLKYVYLGNVSRKEDNTRCPRCGELLLERSGFFLLANRITDEGKCPGCGAKFDGMVRKNKIKT
ncbi:MAG: AmmeMemoRadiSam system radical SAM enzyme [Proteobacteria bacterium]|nr:AmmeMemoRadiSam system radical SAM enzyme [Pseudomonadota bacterium]